MQDGKHPFILPAGSALGATRQGGCARRHYAWLRVGGRRRTVAYVRTGRGGLTSERGTVWSFRDPPEPPGIPGRFIQTNNATLVARSRWSEEGGWTSFACSH